jgi:uncharacterized phage protein (TIGR01671 family)
MRQIKYRAFDVKDKIMWEPLTLTELASGTWELQTKDQEHSLPSDDYFEFAQADTVWMQFTGLQDQHETDIYEGDWIDTGNGIGFIVWFGTGWGIESPGSEAVDSFFMSEMYDWTVVGNIYENPDLLIANSES